MNAKICGNKIFIFRLKDYLINHSFQVSDQTLSEKSALLRNLRLQNKELENASRKSPKNTTGLKFQLWWGEENFNDCERFPEKISTFD